MKWLPDVLRAAGLRVEVQGVSPRPGDYAPRGVLIHHTATAASTAKPAPTLGLVQRGRHDLPGPLCQILVGWDGTCHVITTGRANHAGQARPSGPMPGGDGNELYVGIEVDYSGYVAPSPAQYAATVTATAAILTRLGKSADYARGHRETSTTGKWDPGHVDLDAFRSLVATAMTPAPVPPAPSEEDDMIRLVQIGNSPHVYVVDYGQRTLWRAPDPRALAHYEAVGIKRITGGQPPQFYAGFRNLEGRVLSETDVQAIADGTADELANRLR